MSKWYCRICNSNLNAGPYCIENHFRKNHPRRTPREKADGGKWNWSCNYENPKKSFLKKFKQTKERKMKIVSPIATLIRRLEKVRTTIPTRGSKKDLRRMMGDINKELYYIIEKLKQEKERQ